MIKNIYFETIKCEDYEVHNLEYHKKRIANTIGKNIDIQEYIYPPNKDLLKCKLNYNQDEIFNYLPIFNFNEQSKYCAG